MPLLSRSHQKPQFHLPKVLTMDSLTMLKQWRASTTKASHPTIASTILQEDEDGDGDDEGPFIDLEFSVPDVDSCKDSDDDAAAAAALRALETSSLVFSSSESNSKPQFAVSLLKSATKFRVFMLGSKKPKTSASSPKHQLNSDNKKMFVRFKVEEVPLMSLFTRDTSSKNNNNNNDFIPGAAAAASTDDKKFSKEVLQKYLSKIKRLRFSGQVGSVSSVSKPVSDGDPPPSVLKTVNRRLGKSRSASATVAAVRSPPRRRDDSLLQQQDGIQSAIAHCKRSFNAEKAPELPLQLVRSNSDPGNGRQETCKAETKVDLH